MALIFQSQLGILILILTTNLTCRAWVNEKSQKKGFDLRRIFSSDAGKLARALGMTMATIVKECSILAWRDRVPVLWNAEQREYSGYKEEAPVVLTDL